MRLLEIKPDGTEVWFKHDPIEKKNIIHYKNPDVEPVLDYAKALRLSAESCRRSPFRLPTLAPVSTLSCTASSDQRA